MTILINGNCWDVIATTPDNYYDAIITDPPYDDKINIVELNRICKGNIIVFCKPENQFFTPDEYLFWIKTPSTKNYKKNCGRFVEMILVLRKGETFNQLHWSQMTGVYEDKVIDRDGHQWRKPLSLIERLIRIYTKEGDIVLDPFCGSGTTLVACRNLGREATGIELDPVWYEHVQKEVINGR